MSANAVIKPIVRESLRATVGNPGWDILSFWLLPCDLHIKVALKMAASSYAASSGNLFLSKNIDWVGWHWCCFCSYCISQELGESVFSVSYPSKQLPGSTVSWVLGSPSSNLYTPPGHETFYEALSLFLLPWTRQVQNQLKVMCGENLYFYFDSGPSKLQFRSAGVSCFPDSHCFQVKWTVTCACVFQTIVC